MNPTVVVIAKWVLGAIAVLAIWLAVAYAVLDADLRARWAFRAHQRRRRREERLRHADRLAVERVA